MTNAEDSRVSGEALAPISFTFDPAKLIETMWPNLPYSSDPDLEQPEPFAGPREVIQKIVADKLYQDLSTEIRNFISQELRDTVQGQVEAILREVIANPIVPTNRFGDRTGETTTLKEMITKQAQDQLKSKVNSRGEVDMYGNRDGTTWLSYVVGQQVAQVMKGELQQAVADATQEARDQLKEAVKETFAEQVAATVTRNLR